MKECQSRITGGQALEFGVKGRRARIDSKLVGSNIAWYSRYELVHETLRQFIGEREEHIFKKTLPREMFILIESIQGEKRDKLVYRSTMPEVDARMVELGKLMHRLVKLFKGHDYGHYLTLKTVFEQQYTVDGKNNVTPLEKEKISPKSIQSPHDTDCHYRNKDGNRVKGYSVNITETCDIAEEGDDPVLNLMTDTEVAVVSAPDNGFLEQALEHISEGVGIDLVLTAMQGATPRYGIRLDGQDGDNLIVTDNKIGETIQAYPVKAKDKNRKKWKIKTENGKWKQFDSNSIRAAALRQKLRDIPISEKNTRNNVEASIFQLGYHFPNDKSRYRGLAKHKLWAYSRTLWINFVRIMNYITRISQRTLFGQKPSQYITNLCFNMYIIVSIFSTNKFNQNCPPGLTRLFGEDSIIYIIMDNLKGIGIIGLIVISQLFNACNTRNDGTSETDKDGQDMIEIKVGTKVIKTNKVTVDGTPVVPMWNAQMATDDLRKGAGFPILTEAEHAAVWEPATKDEGAYNHYACLIHYKGKFYAMWGNHPLGEDAPGQRVLYATSETWGEWSNPQELFPAPGPVLPRKEKGIHLKPDRWAVIDDQLFAITYVHGAGIYPIARIVSESGELGEPFLVENLPNNGALPVYMQRSDTPVTTSPIGVRLYNWYRENDLISWWAADSWGVQRKSVEGQSLIESFIYRARDGGLVLMLRDWGHNNNPVHNNRLYVSFNDGKGGWAIPHPTDIPDSPSRAQAITLENGTVLLIGNQNVNHFDQALYLDRDPMTISVSKDGYTFDRVYTLRTNSPTGNRFSGIGGRNPGYAYSSSIVLDGWLYTLYSIGKEDMGITRVPLSSIE